VHHPLAAPTTPSGTDSPQAAAPTQPTPSIPDDARWHGIRREAKRLEKVRQRQEAAHERQFLAEERVPGAAHAREALIAAVHSLANNRLRSFLTTTGIIIGTAAVIVLVALGNGMKTHFNAQFSRLANQITITSVEGSGAGGTVPRDLTDQDVAALRDPSLAPDIASVSPAMTGTVTLAAAQNQDRANLVGATDNYLELVDRKIVAGNWISSSRGSGGDRQAVLGQQALTLLWGPGTDPQQVVGFPVRIDRTTFKVVGVLDSNGQNDNVVITPFDAARTYLVGDNVGKVDQIIVKSTSVETIDQATRQIVEVLDLRHRIKSVNTRDYNVLTFTSLLEKSSQFINFLTMFIVAIAAISLLVGGIGVANIMLVSVTERTREIGIRKAVGATRRAIMRQFLSEAVMLTGLGGVMGVALGVGLTLAGGFLLPPAGSAEASDTNFPAPILTASPVLVAFAVSLIIGVLAGGYPAFRAARMRPIEALRFE
jgi:ABC-type antimicrobial peptide transport system permease subunit